MTIAGPSKPLTYPDCEAALDARFQALMDAGGKLAGLRADTIAAGWQPNTVAAALESLERHHRAMVLDQDEPQAD